MMPKEITSKILKEIGLGKVVKSYFVNVFMT